MQNPTEKLSIIQAEINTLHEKLKLLYAEESELLHHLNELEGVTYAA